MKYVILFLSVFLFTYTCFSQVRVRGYFRKNGTFVSPHIRTSPDGILWNNYSYRPGIIPNLNGGNTSVQGSNYQLVNPNPVINSLPNGFKKVENSKASTVIINDNKFGREKLIDTIKFNNEYYLQKFKKFYDKKNLLNN